MVRRSLAVANGDAPTLGSAGPSCQRPLLVQCADFSFPPGSSSGAQIRLDSALGFVWRFCVATGL